MRCIARPCSWAAGTKARRGRAGKAFTRAIFATWTATSSTSSTWVRLKVELQVHGNSSLRISPTQLGQALQLTVQRGRSAGTFHYRAAQHTGALLRRVADDGLHVEGAAGVHELGGYIAVGIHGAIG